MPAKAVEVVGAGGPGRIAAAVAEAEMSDAEADAKDGVAAAVADAGVATAVAENQMSFAAAGPAIAVIGAAGRTMRSLARRLCSSTT